MTSCERWIGSIDVATEAPEGARPARELLDLVEEVRTSRPADTGAILEREEDDGTVTLAVTTGALKRSASSSTRTAGIAPWQTIQVVCCILVILAVTMLGLGFPYSPTQVGLTLLTVGVPTLFLTAWARPSPPDPHLLGSLARFVIPAAVITAAAGVGM